MQDGSRPDQVPGLRVPPPRQRSQEQGLVNPFATVGHPVHGSAHVGREELVRVLQQRVLEQSTAGATAIIGPPRIGKSSLAYHVFMRPESRRMHPRLLPVWMNVRTQGGIFQLMCRLVEDVWELLEEQPGSPDRRLQTAYERASRPGLAGLEMQVEAQEFLRLVRRRGWRVVLVLDEFDAAREVFKDQPGTFQALREIAYNLDWNVGLVTTSRRELREIVDMADPDESTFAGIFRSVFLTCFDDTDLGALVSRLPNVAAPDRVEATVSLKKLTGGHPYLASVLLDRICSETDSALPLPAAVEGQASPLPAEFHYYYQDLESLLRADGRLRALMEIVLGPQLTVTAEDAQALLQQGLIVVRGGAYGAFSENFERHLVLIGRQLSDWDNWMAVEQRLRDLLDSSFTERYGENWEPHLRASRPKLASLLDSCAQLREREQRTFGHRASNRLLDFTYPRELYDLMVSHWDVFAKILGKDKAYWNERFSLLAKVRNPMAHNRMTVVTAIEQRTFRLYCDELLDLLDRWSRG